MRTFGLIGENLENSFSSKYFNDKFLQEGIKNVQYLNFELQDISEFNKLKRNEKILGLNVTIPYKELIMPFLDELSQEAKIIGAVNTVRFINGKLIGYNTDYIGFKNSLQPLLRSKNKAVILGDGGAAKAVKYALKELGIEYKSIKRDSSSNSIDKAIQNAGYYTIIVNATPLGSYPKTHEYPKIPYKYLNENYLLFDLIYNPKETAFMKYGKERNTEIKNGLEMLKIQAEESWKIWNT